MFCWEGVEGVATNFLLSAALGAWALAVVPAQAQTTVARGTTRLESGGLRLLHGPTAAYPAGARERGIEGTVVIEASMDAKGHVLDAHVVSGPNELRAPALKSVLDDHFAVDTARQVQLSLIFALDKTAPGRATAGGRVVPATADDVTSPIAVVDCPVLPAELCRDVRQLFASAVGTPLTPEKRAELLKALQKLDDDLLLEVRKVPTGVQLLIWMPSTPDVPAGIVGGVASGLATFAPPPPPPPPAPRTPASSAPVRVGGTVGPPAKTKDVKPVYPAIARTARVQGVVLIEATIGPNGSVQDAKVLRSIPLLDEAALDAVRQWQFTPTIVNGVAVPVIMTTSVSFSLQ
jgi:TonB family protein